jgi:hypothetical protein
MLKVFTAFFVLATGCTFSEGFRPSGELSISCFIRNLSKSRCNPSRSPCQSSFLFTDAFNVGNTGATRTCLASSLSPWMMPDEVSISKTVSNVCQQEDRSMFPCVPFTHISVNSPVSSPRKVLLNLGDNPLFPLLMARQDNWMLYRDF